MLDDWTDNDILLQNEAISIDENLESLIINNFKYLNIMHVNIRSVNKNYDELLILLENLKKEVHILILTETWLTDVMPSNLNIPNFSAIHVKNRYNKCDGILIYVSNAIDVENIIYHPIENCNSCRVTINFEKTMYYVTAIYRPWQCNIEMFNDALYDFFSDQKSENEIIIGDINIDLLSRKDSFGVNSYKTILTELGFISLINSFTRIENRAMSCLDHVWVKKNTDNLKAYIIKTRITDHFPVGIVFQSKSKKGKIDKLTVNKFYLHQAVEDVNKICWDELYTRQDINEATSFFINKISKCVISASKQEKINKKHVKLTPWITAGILTSIRNRNKLHRRLVANPNNVQLKSQYKRYRNKLTNIIKIAKNNYFGSKIQSVRSDSGKVWKIINKSLGNVKKCTDIKELQFEDTKVTEKLEIINCLNDYFANVGDKLAKKQTTCCNCSLENNIATIPSISESIVFWPIETAEILNYINNLKNDVAPGADQIPAQLIKSAKEAIVEPLKYIVNLTLDSGIFPTIFKRAIITPIHKGGPASDMSNWRPISLISNFAKIVEKCIRRQLLNFLDKHKIFSENQYGFRSGRSTSNVISTLIERITGDLENNKKNLTVFLDLKKAFDTVSHDKLLAKLYSYGVRGSALNLVNSYLKGREQQVKLNDKLSKSCTPYYGTPQGTTLSPCLFLCYVNDIHKIQHFPGDIIQFADDTCLIFSGENWPDVYKKAEDGLKQINKWLHNNLLYLNTNKTKFITFSPTKVGQPDRGHLILHSCNCMASVCRGDSCKIIERTESIKYLGLNIDQHVSWKKHVSELCNKLRKFLYYFRILRGFCDKSLLKIIYISLVQSILEYGIHVWGSVYPSHLNSLEVVQKAILKIILGRPRDYPSIQLFREFQVLNLKQLFKMNIITHHYNRQKDYFNHQYQTRNNTRRNLRITKCKTKLYKSQANNLFPSIFNNLPSKIRDVNHPTKLRKALLEWFINETI